MERTAGAYCPLCAEAGTTIGHRDGVPVRQCCGIALSWPHASAADYEALYRAPGVYHEAMQRQEGQAPYWDRDTEAQRAAVHRLDQLEAFRKPVPGRLLLDIGAATGAFVSVARMRGWQALGLEPNAAMAQEARDSRRPVQGGGWEDATGGWDVLTLHDVFEHLVRPRACLEHLRSCLHPGGLVVIEMPEWDCPAQRRDGLAWKHLRPQQHPCLYSAAAAERLFTAAGFQLVGLIRPLSGALGKATYYLTPVERPGEGSNSSLS